MLRSLVWTMARRLPGVWWAKSTTTKLVPSIVMTIPRRTSVALIIMALRVAPARVSLVRGPRNVRAIATFCLDSGNAYDTTRFPGRLARGVGPGRPARPAAGREPAAPAQSGPPERPILQ